jgi:hypothetical protein
MTLLPDPAAILQSSADTNICQVFKELAIWTWDRLETAHDVGMPFGEETVTDHLLLELAVRCPTQIKVIPFTKKREHDIGADWEWWFWSSLNRAIGFRIQAKKLDCTTARYESLKFKPCGAAQIDQLIAAAASDRLIPMYCFYNFEPRKKNFKFLNSRHQGCSLAHADTILRARKKTGSVVQQLSKPWHELVCTPNCDQLSLSGIAKVVEGMSPEVPSALELIQRLPGYVAELALERKRFPASSHTGSRDKLGREHPIRGIVTVAVEDSDDD